MSARRILHVDLDAFYASVEVRERPELRGLPVIVGADPKGGEGRGVVTTASYEARKYGVHSAMPISRAWRLCPDGIFLRPNFRLYSEASEAVFAILEETGATIEGASIDEAYLDVSGIAATVEDTVALARRIQREIESRERMTASVGVAANKLVAKIATDMQKPRGLTVVRPGGEAAFLAPLPVRKIPGVGPKTEALLHAMGVESCGALAAIDPQRMAERLGAWGPRLVELARGVDESSVSDAWERKSLGGETTFMEDVRNVGELERVLAELVQEGIGGLEKRHLTARTITLKLRLADFTTFTRSRTVDHPTGDARVFRPIARELLTGALPEGASVRLLGVRFSQLFDASLRQTNLDEWPADVYGVHETRMPPAWF